MYSVSRMADIYTSRHCILRAPYRTHVLAPIVSQSCSRSIGNLALRPKPPARSPERTTQARSASELRSPPLTAPAISGLGRRDEREMEPLAGLWADNCTAELAYPAGKPTSVHAWAGACIGRMGGANALSQCTTVDGRLMLNALVACLVRLCNLSCRRSCVF